MVERKHIIMAIIDELNEELIKCNAELAETEKQLIVYQERTRCCTEKKNMLEALIRNASSEAEKAVKAKPIPTKTDAVKRTKTKPAETAAAPEENQEPTEMTVIAMADLAKKLDVPTSEVADACNRRGWHLPRINDKYMLTESQADEISNAIDSNHTVHP